MTSRERRSLSSAAFSSLRAWIVSSHFSSASEFDSSFSFKRASSQSLISRRRRSRSCLLPVTAQMYSTTLSNSVRMGSMICSAALRGSIFIMVE